MILTKIGLLQIAVCLLTVLVFVKPLGWYMAQVYEGKPLLLDRFLRPFERFIYRLCGVNVDQAMDWKHYLVSMLVFNAFGLLFVYIIQRLQAYLPFNPQHLDSPDALLAFNTAASFVSNTNWQSYSGETTMSYLTQMLGLTSQNFLSAATGLSLLVAFIRGLVRHQSSDLGNFWVDLVRGTLYIFFPLSCVLAVFLVSQGVIQNLKPNQHVSLLQSIHLLQNQDDVMEQVIPMGPVASQIAIKQLGSNGGGFFNANSAHPFENPTPLSNCLEMLAIFLIPAASCYMFGRMVNDKRQGWALLAAMGILFIPFLFVAMVAEQQGNPAFTTMGIDQVAQYTGFPGGNMEGKETRFGIVNSVLWTLGTTATSNGSVNSMLDSYTPLGGLMPLWMMHLGEVVFGGVGCGLYSMLMMVVLTVFVGGLMVGRTPEYLGKKIEPFEMKMASFAVLIMPLFVLLVTAFSIIMPIGRHALGNPEAHGLTEMLYAFTSLVNNNGSAFSGINLNTPFYNFLGGLLMLIGRYGLAIPALAIAGSLVEKKLIPNSSGTLATHTPLFTVLLVGVVILLGALSFLPVLALGPIVEHLMLWNHYGH
ncbi:MAG: potassium-transporting ATPase subunit KdpA [Legionellaceae bacterium]|nr:potassium-transporting ATPase subunit KdpA [Legionellaceae bacterium]